MTRATSLLAAGTAAFLFCMSSSTIAQQVPQGDVRDAVTAIDLPPCLSESIWVATLQGKIDAKEGVRRGLWRKIVAAPPGTPRYRSLHLRLVETTRNLHQNKIDLKEAQRRLEMCRAIHGGTLPR